MIFEALRRRVVRYFRPAATSVPPQKGPYRLDSVLYTIDPSHIEFGSARAIPHRLLPGIEHLEVEATRPGLKPPADPAADGWSWDAWAAEVGRSQLPGGWVFCRFVHRTEDKAIFVFGNARGAFGVYTRPMPVTSRGELGGIEHSEQVLTTVVHLRSGTGMAVFWRTEDAAMACDLAERVCPEWLTLDEPGGAAWFNHCSRSYRAWTDMGIRPDPQSHIHDDTGRGFAILGLTIQSASEGKPERPS